MTQMPATKRVKFIELMFENCQVAELEPSMFRYLYLSDITKSYSINYNGASPDWRGDIHTTVHCRRFQINVTEKGLEKAKFKPEHLEPITLRERLAKHRDLVAVDLNFTDGTSEYIYIPWSGEKWTNLLQRHKKVVWHDKGTDLQITAEEK